MLVHMATEQQARRIFEKYDLHDARRISDPDQVLYGVFKLARGSATQMMNPRVLARGLKAIFSGHGPGRPLGDPAQMPGVFLIRQGRIEQAYRHQSVADRPDYLSLAACPLPGQQTNDKTD